MLIIIICRLNLKLGHVGSKTRLLDQILDKHCGHSKRHGFDPKCMKLCLNVNPHNIQHAVAKQRVVVQDVNAVRLVRFVCTNVHVMQLEAQILSICKLHWKPLNILEFVDFRDRHW